MISLKKTKISFVVSMSIVLLLLILFFCNGSEGNPVKDDIVYNDNESDSESNLDANENIDLLGFVDESRFESFGDMRLPREWFISSQLNQEGSNGTRGPDNFYRSTHWPNKRIPYGIQNNVFSEEVLRTIRRAMAHIERHTCVRFVNDTSYKYWVRINYVHGGCAAVVGFNRALVNDHFVGIDPDHHNCKRPNLFGVLVHELTHVVGFYHEHTRNDRDDFVNVNYNNIVSLNKKSVLRNYGRNRDQDPPVNVDYFGVPYNYDSIMHYDSGRSIIVPIGRPRGYYLGHQKNIGQRRGLSKGDIESINRMYDCTEFFKKKKKRRK